MPKTQQTPASVLESLMKEYQLNPFSLSKQIGLSNSSIRQILIGKTGISISTALRLSRFFGQCPSYWLDLQLQSDMQAAANDKELQTALKNIKKAAKPKPPAKAKPQEKAKLKPAKKTTLADKRKKASKIPGAKPASRKPSKK